jgi:hypothetical protein
MRYGLIYVCSGEVLLLGDGFVCPSSRNVLGSATGIDRE